MWEEGVEAVHAVSSSARADAFLHGCGRLGSREVGVLEGR